MIKQKIFLRKSSLSVLRYSFQLKEVIGSLHLQSADHRQWVRSGSTAFTTD